MGISNNIINFQADLSTFANQPDSAFDEIAFNQDNSLANPSLTIPCVNVAGKNYEVKLTCPSGNFIDWTLSDISEK
ncbi:MAG: hypothetical protein HQK73_01570 [Desulfamplus sp.]|nr:hypothetical protein [Desulfamplus sp.]MBF0412523.1 hypothetical protein [Desulfamplus sp.]